MPGPTFAAELGSPEEVAYPWREKMHLTLELSDQEAQKLQGQAAELGVTPEQLARRVLTDLLAEPEEQFRTE